MCSQPFDRSCGVRRPSRFRGSILATLCAIAVYLPSGSCRAMCNAIPAAVATFRGVTGSVDRPFAGPGRWVEVTLDESCDADTIFPADPQQLIVMVVFKPADGPRHVLVLAADCDAIEIGACARRHDVEAARCIPAFRPDRLPEVQVLASRAMRFQ